MFNITKILLQVPIAHLKFNLKTFILSYKLALKQQMQNSNLLQNTLLNLALLIAATFILILAFCYKDDDIKATLFMIDGAIISIWVTYTISIMTGIYKTSENLSTTFNTIANMSHLFTSFYDFFVVDFPYSDELFKKDDSILYISPIEGGDKEYLNETLAMNFLTYLQNLQEENNLVNAFDETKARLLIKSLAQQHIVMQSAQISVFSSKDFLSVPLVSLFEQTIGLVNGIISFGYRYSNWNDPQLKNQASTLFYAYTYKLTTSTLAIQREKVLYKEYISHISHPPKLIKFKSIDEVIKANEFSRNKKNPLG
jgi:hypothetical protein